MQNRLKRRTTVKASCRIDINKVLMSVMSEIDKDFDDIHLKPSVTGWPCNKRQPLTEFKLPNENMLGLQIYGSFINHIYYKRLTMPFQYTVHGIKLHFAVVAERKVRDIVDLLRDQELVGRYNDVILTPSHIGVIPTKDFIAVRRLQRGEELCLPPELDLIT